MAHMLRKLVLLGAMAFMFAALTCLSTKLGVAQSCGTVQLSCIDCDSGEIFFYQCCTPSGCLPVEIGNDDCNGPAVCSYKCNGTV